MKEIIPVLELAERAALEKVKAKLKDIEKEHIEQNGASCQFSAIRKAGSIFVECDVCRSETKLASLQPSLQAIRVHIQQDKHKGNICYNYERLSLKSEDIVGKEMKEITNATFARELEPGTFIVSSDNVECIHCHENFLLLPKGGKQQTISQMFGHKQSSTEKASKR